MKLERVAFAVGLGLFVWLLHRIGVPGVVHNLALVGWGFSAVLALEIFSLLLSTLGWRSTSPRLRSVPFRSLLAMRLAGDSINALAPAAVVGGEIVRARLLTAFLPAAQALASVGLAAMAQFAAQVVFVALGSLALPPELFPRPMRFAGPGLLLLVAILLAIVVKRRSPPPNGRDAARAPASSGGGIDRSAFLTELRKGVASALRERPTGLPVSVLFFLAGWSFTIVEIALILRLLGSPVGLRTSSAIAVALVLVEGVFFFVPARAGVTEGGLYAIFSLLRLDPAKGFSLAIVRRLRELAWALVGLTILGWGRFRTVVIARE